MVTRNHGGENREMLRAEITTSNSENPEVVEIEAMRWAIGPSNKHGNIILEGTLLRRDCIQRKATKLEDNGVQSKP
uniref:Uncharacterized protein n=1 Tax=Quercus lobata TaxID=97700 RepID=A0A7N2M2K0_QUELO